MSQVAHLKVIGPATAGNSVPADVLVTAIQGVQQTLWLLAAAAETRVLVRRFKPDEAFRQRFTLRLAIPSGGSYAVPMTLAETSAW